jgi:hypothetical protein
MQKSAQGARGLNVPAIFLLIGLGIMGASVYFGWRTEKKLEAVAAWPTTPAYVAESRIEWVVRASQNTRSAQRSYSYSYMLTVLAAYQVDGNYYTSTTPAITTIRDRKVFRKRPWQNPPDADIVALFKQLPQGAVVPIHYNPANPSEAYVFSSLPFWKLYTMNVFFFCFGVLPALFGLVPMWLNRRYRRQDAQRAGFSGPIG